MNLSEYRRSQGLTLEQAAAQLGLSPKSASWICEIEGGRRDASIRLALKIERWSSGSVPADSVCADLRKINSSTPSEQAAA